MIEINGGYEWDRRGKPVGQEVKSTLVQLESFVQWEWYQRSAMTLGVVAWDTPHFFCVTKFPNFGDGNGWKWKWTWTWSFVFVCNVMEKNIVFHGLNLNFPNRSSHFGASPPFSEKSIYLHTFRESNKVNIPYIS